MNWGEGLLSLLAIGWCIVVSGGIVYIMDWLKKGENE